MVIPPIDLTVIFDVCIKVIAVIVIYIAIYQGIKLFRGMGAVSYEKNNESYHGQEDVPFD